MIIGDVNPTTFNNCWPVRSRDERIRKRGQPFESVGFRACPEHLNRCVCARGRLIRYHPPGGWIGRWPEIGEEQLDRSVRLVNAGEANNIDGAIILGASESAQGERLELQRLWIHDDDGISSRTPRHVEVALTALVQLNHSRLPSPGARGGPKHTWDPIESALLGRSRRGRAGASLRRATNPRTPADVGRGYAGIGILESH